ncbi:hypothetical protein TRVA0_012S02718 [Trichomonascus vanleenenianus]|uniref:uncharacterized protein n=1 Tax=Trichomonascus vanleenenianus TaxID=2268995 RepID=UPI003ECB771C
MQAPLTPSSELDPFEALHTDKVRHKLITDKYAKLYPKVDAERSRQIVNDLMTTRFNVLQQYMALLSTQYNMIDPEHMGAVFDFSISTIEKICSDLESADAEGYRKANSTCFSTMFPNPLPASISPHVSQLRRALEDHERANTMLEQLMKGVL